MRRLKAALAVFVGTPLLAVCLSAQTPESQSPSLPPEGPQEEAPAAPAGSTAKQAVGADYIIGPEDVLDVDVFGVPELSKTVRVANDGTISLALLGHVQAAGLTPSQLRKELEAKWGETYLENPQISVFVKEYQAQPVSVIGAVERPGLYQLTGPRTLIEVLSMAGGLARRTTAAAGRTLIVTRNSGFSDFPVAPGMRLIAFDKLEIDIQKLLYSPESALNIEIKPLDTISVTRADVVYVVGDVKKPTGIVMADQEGLTVLQALAMAEGFNRTAARKSARIIRKLPDGSKIEIPVNLDKVLKGKENDVELAANDILFVPDSKGKFALYRGIEATIATVSGVIIWGSR